MTVCPENWFPPVVVIAGTGIIGKSGKISRDILRWLARAELIACSEAFLPMLGDFNVEKITIKSPLEPLIERIKKESETRRVMVLASGDPLFHGIGRQLGAILGRDRIIVLPNISSVQYLFARLAIPWDDVLFFSLHREERRDFFYWLRLGRKVAILTSPKNSPSYIANLVADYEMSDMVDIAVGENLGAKDERIVITSAEEVSGLKWREPNVVALLPRTSARRIEGFLREDDFQHEKGMITKREIRALIVSALRLKPSDVLWDLGAGSGSVSIEACYRLPLKAVHAVERDSNRFEKLLKNLKMFHCGEVVPHLGDAVELIHDLPAPDRVFIGGGGKDMGLIIRAIYERFRKSRTPLIVVSAVLWDSVNEVLRVAKDCLLSVSIMHVQVSRSAPLLDSFRFEPLSPVFLITLEPPNP